VKLLKKRSELPPKNEIFKNVMNFEKNEVKFPKKLSELPNK
jgi:hypothetical protein